jgi:ribonuclease HI
MAQQLLFLQVDGSPGAQPRDVAGLGAAIRNAEGRVLLWRCGTAPARTNNEAEYQAMIFGLELALRRFPGAALRCLTDSRIVVDQLTGRSAVHAKALQPLHTHAQMLARRCARIEFVAIPRTLNRLADALAWEAIDGQQALMQFLPPWRQL